MEAVLEHYGTADVGANKSVNLEHYDDHPERLFRNRLDHDRGRAGQQHAGYGLLLVSNGIPSIPFRVRRFDRVCHLGPVANYDHRASAVNAS